MFDGNHRTSRRAVNLGSRNNGRQRKNNAAGGRNNATKQGRAAILEQTQRQRAERALQQKRIKACLVIQRQVRGFLQRVRLMRELQRLILVENNNNNLESWTQQCNVMIRLLLSTRIQSTGKNTDQLISQVLQIYAQQLPTDSTNTTQPSYTKYLWQQTLLRCLNPTKAMTSDINTVSDMETDDNAMTMRTAQQILQYCLPAAQVQQQEPWKLLGVSGLLLLCETLLTWQEQEQQEQRPQNDDSARLYQWLNTYVSQIMPQPQGLPLLGVLQWTTAEPAGAVSSNTESSNNKSVHTLAALVRAMMQQQSPPTASLQNQTDATSATLSQAAVQLVMKHKQQQQDTKTPTRLLQVLQQVLTLSSATDNIDQNNLLPPTLVVPLIYHVWQKSPILMHATSLVAHTGNTTALAHLFETTANPKSNNNEAMDVSETPDDDLSDEEDDDDNNLKAHAKTVTVPKSYGAGTRVTKQDILTAPKLERLAATTRTGWVKQLEEQQRQQQTFRTATNRKILEDCAQLLASPRLWLSWGQTLLTTTMHKEHEQEQVQGRHAYMACLSLLLQGSGTGLYSRTSASSKLLTQLAFGGTTRTAATTAYSHKSFAELLWKTVLVQVMNSQQDDASQVHALTTWSVFCDVMTHLLIAVRDEQFLQQYTTASAAVSSISQWKQQPTSSNSNSSNDIVISAEHVIQHLRDALYELYWARPVLAAETQFVAPGVLAVDSGSSKSAGSPNGLVMSPALAASRVRFFLTGTKLWNSLYDRWCRLLKHSPFCDESKWLFPSASMTTLTFGDGIVRRPDGTIHQDDDANNRMDVDSDDDSMSVEDDSPGAETEQDAEADALAGAFQDPKMARILTSIPQCLPFERRVKLFQTLLQVDKAKTQDESADMQATMLAMMRGEDFEGATSRINVEIRRASLYDDSMRQLNQLGPKLKRKLKVSFINQHGVEEAGIDGGGVFKEFLDDLIKDAFSPPPATTSPQQQEGKSLQLFAVTPLETLMVNPLYTRDPQYLSHYEFLGRAVGKAVYESLLVEPQFCLPFLNTLLGKSNTLEDLKNYDPEYYSNLVKLMNMSREDIASTGLTFEVNLKSDAKKLVELIPGGANTAVTKDNVIQYAHLVSHRLLNVQAAPQIRAFLRGFRDLIPASWVRLFSSHELQKLVSGDDSVQGIDVASLKACMQYAAGYHPSQPVIHWFWDIVENDMTAKQQCQFLKFMTSCSRQPLLGFASLEPHPCIQQIRLPDHMFVSSTPGEITKKLPLPTSATCMNLLKLPNYRSKDVMRQKLFAAIEAGAGFELS